MQYLDGKTTVTHIIASSLTPKKAVEFRRYRIVKPAWVVDSIQAGKLLPWNDYRVVDEGENQKLLAFNNKGKVLSEANVKTRGYRDQTDGSWYTSQLRGSQASPLASTPTPSSTMRSRFLRQRLPTPDDEIDDLPPSHQPEFGLHERTLPSETGNPNKPEELVTPPKTSPPPEPQSDAEGALEPVGNVDEQDDSLYDDPTPPNAQAAQPHEVKSDRERNDDDSVPHAKKNLTAEEHNAILLQDPKVRKSTVVDPNFLEQYYRESRLHHLSTWKADLKSQLQALASERSSSQKQKQKRPPGARRYVLHVDFDSFFAAVSLKKHAHLKDKPVAIAHGGGSGSEIASCNYPARKFGIKNGMWMKRAQELCADLKVLPYDFPAYEEASRAFYDAILTIDGIVQSVSIDEALIDISNSCIAAGGSDGKHMSEGSVFREQAWADKIAQSLREKVKEKTGCNVSVGIGNNILLAKVALRKAKPAGQYHINPEEVLDFLGQLQVQDLPGVAWSIGGKLEEIGIKFVKDIRECSKERLVQTLGPKTGEKLWEYARGIDKAEVGEQVVRKSVSAEVNWGVRFENQEQVDEFISSLCGELQKRLLKEKVKGKQFTMKVMRRSPDAPLDPPKHLGHGKCDTYNKSIVLGISTNSTEVLVKEALSVLKGFGFSPGELRGIGVQMTKLEPMKSATDGSFESSQRLLQFKTSNKAIPNPAEPAKIAEADPIQDDPETPRKPRANVEEEHISYGAVQLNHSTPSRRPLNMLGTQFIIPTQVDPRVLAELPEDIRSKLLRQARQSSPTPAARKGTTKISETSPAKGVSFALIALPAHSQLDPEILAALPPDVRAEVLSQYAASATPQSPSRRPRYADQTLLPQSPRKNRIIGIPAKRPLVPVKRGRGRPPKSAQLAAAAIATAKSKNGKTLTQANFISIKNPERSREDSAPVEVAVTVSVAPANRDSKSRQDDLDSDFLAALPEDVRKEVLEEHKRKKLHASRLALQRKQHAAAAAAIQPPRVVQKLKVPRPRTATFTAQKFSCEKELRSAIRAWAEEFAEEGPYDEDVDALGRYLGRVVGEERDLAKAVRMVVWLGWVVGELEGEGESEIDVGKWEEAVERVKKGVRDKAGERGLASVVFD
ncbi:DNA damage repair protein-like protein Mus42 [Massariosphaeria phaeospora]|uniref:DNA repair protein REV1 n=1 Tax=Massariosphaeria phaeospora TaxID=100035 RepID=A0A7C8MJ10_9PLEO|nr:DNA damage repair protein-like protein Mus42 [Massariosphaeria phaeospora]